MVDFTSKALKQVIGTTRETSRLKFLYYAGLRLQQIYHILSMDARRLPPAVCDDFQKHTCALLRNWKKAGCKPTMKHHFAHHLAEQVDNRRFVMTAANYNFQVLGNCLSNMFDDHKLWTTV